MKSWFQKFRASAALDKKSGGSRATARPDRAPSDIADFELALHKLDRRLRANPPQQDSSKDLHASIMERIHAAPAQQQQDSPPRMGFSWGWVAAAGAACVLLLTVWFVSVRPGNESAERVPAPAPQITASSVSLPTADPRSATLAAVQPMNQELVLLQRDCQRVVQTVFASLPADLSSWSASEGPTK
jgi:hypothetical protein